METPDPPNTPGALKQVVIWHPMTSHGALGFGEIVVLLDPNLKPFWWAGHTRPDRPVVHLARWAPAKAVGVV